MSRSSTFSPALIKAMYSEDSNDTLMSTLTIKYDTFVSFSNNAPQSYIYLCDNYTHRFEYLSDNSCTVTDIRISSSLDAPFVHTYSSTETIIKDILKENTQEVFYGTISDSILYLFMPFSLTLPTDDVGTIPVCKVSLKDITQYLTPIIREITDGPTVDIKLHLYSDPENIPVEILDFNMSSITYTADSVDIDLTIDSYVSEPFPAHNFTPSIFPGLF